MPAKRRATSSKPNDTRKMEHSGNHTAMSLYLETLIHATSSMLFLVVSKGKAQSSQVLCEPEGEGRERERERARVRVRDREREIMQKPLGKQ